MQIIDVFEHSYVGFLARGPMRSKKPQPHIKRPVGPS
jgi:hypothetical protein